MNESELLFGFLIGLMIVASMGILLSTLQILRINKEAEVRQAMKRLRGKDQPSVTVLVHARNSQKYIIHALRALKNTRYHAFDIVVVDDVSTDDTYELVKRFCAKYPQVPLRVLRRRDHTSTSAALQAGYRKSQKGAIVITLTPDMNIDPFLIKRAVASGRQQDTWRVSLSESLVTTLSLFEIGQFLEKYYWQRASSARVSTAKYFVRTKPELENPMLEVTLRAIVTVAVFIGLTSAAFLSLGVKAFWYAWILVTAYGLVVTWLRFGESMRDRLVLTLSIPLALFLIPATGVVRGFSQLSFRK